MIEKAVALDPSYARAYALLAWSHLSDVFMGWSEEPVQSLGVAFETAQKSLALDDSDNWSHWVVGAVLLFQRQHGRSDAAYQRALDLNPNDADVIAHHATYLFHVGKIEDGVESINRAMRLNPRCPWWYFWTLGWAELRAERPEAAIAAIERIGNPIPECRMVTVAGLMALDREAEARVEAAEILKLVPDFTLRQWSATQPYQDPSDFEDVVAALRAAGLPD